MSDTGTPIFHCKMYVKKNNDCKLLKVVIVPIVVWFVSLWNHWFWFDIHFKEKDLSLNFALLSWDSSSLRSAMSYQSPSPSKGTPMAPEGESNGCHPRKPAALTLPSHLLSIWAKNRQLSQKGHLNHSIIEWIWNVLSIIMSMHWILQYINTFFRLKTWEIMVDIQYRTHLVLFSWVAQRSKALHHSAWGITTALGSIPGCVTAGHDRETHEAAYNWPSIGRGKGGFPQLGFPCPHGSRSSPLPSP